MTPNQDPIPDSELCDRCGLTSAEYLVVGFAEVPKVTNDDTKKYTDAGTLCEHCKEQVENKPGDWDSISSVPLTNQHK